MASSSAPFSTGPFDYVIVGGGTSGLVIANRLSEDATKTVLVLEAGRDATKDPRVFAPAAAPSLYFDDDFDWSFTSTPQRQLGGRVISHSMGKMLGGSSAINLGMVIFPSRATFDAWEALGNDGWGWDSMAEYLRRFHTYTPPTPAVKEKVRYECDETLQGKNGPVQVSFADEYTPFHEAWVPIFEVNGFKLTGDPLSGTATGAFTSGASIHPVSKERSHAGVAYYSPEVAARPNLKVVTEAVVDKIELEKDASGEVVATGVWFTTNDGQRSLVKATKEVVLATGAFKTPQLLELSGIGGRSLLDSHGIDVFIDNPNVGENLQDHGLIPFGWEVADGLVSGDVIKNPEVAADAMKAYMTARAGPMGQAPFVSSFIPLILSTAERQNLIEKHVHAGVYPATEAQLVQLRSILQREEEPTVQYSFAPLQLLADHPLPKDIFGMGRDGMFVSVITVLNYPFSRGSTHLHSPRASDKPVIDTGYLENPIDIEILARQLVLLDNIFLSEPMAGLLKAGGRRLHDWENPGGAMDSLEKARKTAKRLIISNWHNCGTAAMMPREKGGVVDSSLRVYGTKNLRVVDASVFPLIPRGNIQASVYAVAEKAADIIKQESP